VKGAPEAGEYQFKVARLQRLERLAEQDRIDLFYGDESGVSLLPCVSSGWQFNDEHVCAPSTSGNGVNCFALLSRDNHLFFRLTEQVIDAALVCDYLDQFVQQRCDRLRVVVLDNAPVHQGRMRQYLDRWQKKGLYVFFLPTYSPHLNIAEVLWRKLKYEWLRAEDYADKESLCYQVRQALAAVGKSLKIAFGDFRQNTN
jgi:transposase